MYEVFFRGFRAKKSYNQPHINNNVRSIWFLELSLPYFSGIPKKMRILVTRLQLGLPEN